MHLLRPSVAHRVRAFTLLELIVAILVLGILVTVAITGFSHVTTTAKQSVAQMNLHTVTTAVLTDQALHPGSAFTRTAVSSALAQATGDTVVDGVAAADVRLGMTDEWPGEGQYAAGFDGEDPDARGDRAALLVTGGGRTYAQILQGGGAGPAGIVPSGTSPSDVLGNPGLIVTPDPGEPDPSAPGAQEPDEAPAPESVSATATASGQLTVSWDATADSYVVVATPVGGGTPQSCASLTSPCTVAGLADGVEYQVTVTATYTDGRQATSAPVTAQTAPAAPAAVNLSVSGTTFTVTWDAPVGATSYTFERRTNGGAWVSSTPTATTVSGSVSAGALLEARVRAHTSTGDSPWSPIASTTTALAAPVVTLASSEGNAATFTWPAISGATSYRLDSRIGTASWVAGSPGTSRSVTVVGTHGETTAVRVVALSEHVTSSYGTASYAVPVWSPMALGGSWVNYGSVFAPAQFTRTSDQVVVLSGLIKGGDLTSGTVLGTLPPRYRPTSTLLFSQVANGTTHIRIEVNSAGAVILRNAPATASGYVSLSGITFIPATATHTRSALTLNNGWSNYGGSFSEAQVIEDSNGRVHLQGLINAGTTTPGTIMATLPTDLRSDVDQYLSALNSTGFSTVGFKNALGATSTTRTGWTSLQGLWYRSSASTKWTDLTPQSSWVRYHSLSPAVQYAKGTDGLVSLRGTVSGGATGSVIATLPPGMRPSQVEVFDVASNFGYGRLDVEPDGSIRVREGVTSAWVSLDSISFRATQ